MVDPDKIKQAIEKIELAEALNAEAAKNYCDARQILNGFLPTSAFDQPNTEHTLQGQFATLLARRAQRRMKPK